MAGVNKVILVGNLGKDPEVRTFQNGNKSVSFTLATSETWKDRTSGERKEKTQWHNIVIFNDNLGGVAERFLKKGSKVYLEGQIESRKYTDNSGAERFITEIVLSKFKGELTLLDGKGEGGGRGESSGGDYERAERESGPSGGYDRGEPVAASRNVPRAHDLDDDVPF